MPNNMFTEKCFIRKYSQELVNKLVELGHNMMRFPEPRYIVCDKNDIYLTSILPDKDIDEYIDCDTNEDLFLAIASLRNDTDRYQWFTDGNITEMSTDDLPSKYMMMEGHKCTVEELIEMFNN